MEVVCFSGNKGDSVQAEDLVYSAPAVESGVDVPPEVAPAGNTPAPTQECGRTGTQLNGNTCSYGD